MYNVQVDDDRKTTKKPVAELQQPKSEECRDRYMHPKKAGNGSPCLVISVLPPKSARYLQDRMPKKYRWKNEEMEVYDVPPQSLQNEVCSFVMHKKAET